MLPGIVRTVQRAKPIAVPTPRGIAHYSLQVAVTAAAIDARSGVNHHIKFIAPVIGGAVSGGHGLPKRADFCAAVGKSDLETPGAVNAGGRVPGGRSVAGGVVDDPTVDT